MMTLREENEVVAMNNNRFLNMVFQSLDGRIFTDDSELC